MKIAVINFSGNVGKSTLARHLLQPRIPGAELIAIESLNASEGSSATLRGDEFAALQEYLQSIPSAVVDIGASSVEEFLDLMQSYRGSHEDFDCFVVPTVPPAKQQQDTIATLIDLSRLGVQPERLRVVFNMTQAKVPVEQAFYLVHDFLAEHPIATANPACQLRTNEIYARIRGKQGAQADLIALSQDATDYLRLIAQAQTSAQKLSLAQQLATCRLAGTVVAQLDACFAGLGLAPAARLPESQDRQDRQEVQETSPSSAGTPHAHA